MEATRVDDSAAPPQPALSKSFSVDAADGKEQEQEHEGRIDAAPSSSEDGESFDGDMLLQEAQFEDDGKGGEGFEAGPVRVAIRARISDEADETEEIGDGEGSFGSAESFDSALERMAESSTASNDAFSSPKGSPVGSYSTPGVWSGLEAAQQGALMRLNELNSGVLSLDMSVISSSETAEDFRARVDRIAERNGLSADDAAVRNILELLVPLVQNGSVSANGNGGIRINGGEDFAQGDETLVSRPVAKVTAEDDPLNNSDEDGSIEEEAGEAGRAEIEADEDGADLEGQHVEEQSHVAIPQSAQGLRIACADEIESEGGEETEQEADLQEGSKEGSESAASEALKLEPQNLKEEDSEPQKPKEEDLQELKQADLEPQKQEERHSEPEHPEEESEHKKTKHEYSEHREAKEGEVEASAKEVVEPAFEERKEETELGKLDTSVSNHFENVSAAQNFEARDGGEEFEGGLQVANEARVAKPEPAEVHDDENQITSETGDQTQISDLAPDRKRSEGGTDETSVLLVEEAKNTFEAASLTDFTSSTKIPVASLEESGPQSEAVVDHRQEEATTPVEIEPHFGKDEEDKAKDVDRESAVSNNAHQSLEVESKISDIGFPETFVKELLDQSVKQDHEPEKQPETIEAGDEPEVDEHVKLQVKDDKFTDSQAIEDPQLKLHDMVLSTKDAHGDSKPIEGERGLIKDNAVDQPIKSVPEEKSDRNLPAVMQSEEGLKNENVLAPVVDEAKAVELLKHAGDRQLENQSIIDSLKSSAVGAAFNNEEDDDEEEESYWNDTEIADDDREDEDDDSLQRSAALAALVRAVDSSTGGTGTPSLGSAGPSLPARPAGLGRSMPSLEPAPRAVQQSSSNGVAASQPSVSVENNQPNGEANDGNAETREKLQAIRVKFLRLAHRLGQTAQNVVVAQVLYRLGLAEQLRGGRSSTRSTAFSFDRASAIAEEQEAAGQEELDFTCTIMLLGKTGVGKSATINSIFDEVKAPTNAFTYATKKVQEITGTVHGIKLRVIDTPGLLPSVADQRQNEKIMASVKRFIKRSPPDIVLYFDRLDMQSRDFGDLPLLRTITDTFGAAIWFNAIVVLTHASSAPPDGPNGVPVSYEMFVAQRSHVVQQAIRQAAGDTRLMNPVSLVENHPACRTNRAGERVLPNGQVWKPQLLLLSFASKILADANSLLKLQESTPGKPFGTRSRVPPLPFLLSSLLQSRAQLKMPEEQIGEEDESDEDVEDEESDDEADYDELPPFRRLSKEEIGELDKEQRRLYFEELEDREKLFQKKQWKEELRRRKEMKKRMATAQRADMPPADELYDEDGAKSAAVPVALPDMALPPTFDSDNPGHRYRYLETASQWLVRPVLETHGWDHDSGYDGLNVEKMLIVGNKVPVSISGQITKDKKEANLTLESAASLKHGVGKVTLAGFDVQTMGKDLSYTLRSETRFSNFKRNKTIAGLAVTMLGDTIAAGMKLEDRLTLGKRLKLVMNGGAITGRGDVAYGGTLEITVRDKDYPISRTLSTLGFSVMDWHGDLAIGGNMQSQVMLGKTMMVARANLNNRGAGQISIRASSSEQFQMALIGIIPIVRALFGNRLFSSSQSN
ncbi:hypothetical protein O6H91_06G082400 [Diphasiastrum complanatum]|uniref:Uncharacterized protein n=1 Tax=Diphasiastrum complanatum TaxID=34168 RepID=A0ACC2DFJ4_DIPCM|nr:hypothetical protein O6H91_06G082400 [Diphasiastrum complanatum]